MRSKSSKIVPALGVSGLVPEGTLPRPKYTSNPGPKYSSRPQLAPKAPVPQPFGANAIPGHSTANPMSYMAAQNQPGAVPAGPKLAPPMYGNPHIMDQPRPYGNDMVRPPIPLGNDMLQPPGQQMQQAGLQGPGGASQFAPGQLSPENAQRLQMAMMQRQSPMQGMGQAMQSVQGIQRPQVGALPQQAPGMAQAAGNFLNQPPKPFGM